MTKTPPRKRVIKMSAISYAHLVKLMLEGTYSCRELAEHTGLHYVTTLQYTRELHRAGAAHISSWEKDSRGKDSTKIYKLGEGKDAPRQRKSKAERAAAYRRKKQTTDLMHMLASPLASE